MNAVNIVEVGPRDGFQNLCTYLTPDQKIDIVRRIVESGVTQIQVTSFVSPKAIPQMRDAAEVAQACIKEFPNVTFSALVPNLRGAKNAWESGIRHISYVVSLSLSHNQANVRRTHEESLEEFKKIRAEFPELHICLDLATAFGCPFEGLKYADEVVPFLKDYVEAGVEMVNLCDTIGIADPAQVRETVAAVKKAYPDMKLSIHIHDTRNMGMVDTLAAIECGVDSVQSTLGGLGGCPFAPGASGNLATEDLVHMLTRMGYPLNVDWKKMVEAAKYEHRVIPDGIYSGHLMRIQDKA